MVIGYDVSEVFKLRKYALKCFKYFVTIIILSNLLTHTVLAIAYNIDLYAIEQVLTTSYVRLLVDGYEDNAEEIRVLMKNEGINNKLFDEIIPDEKITSVEMYEEHIKGVAERYGSDTDLNFVTDSISENMSVINIMSLVGAILQLINIVLRLFVIVLICDLFYNYIKIVKTGFSKIFMMLLFIVSFFMNLNSFVIVILTIYLMIHKLCKSCEFNLIN